MPSMHRLCKNNIVKLKAKCTEAKVGIIACIRGDAETCKTKCKSCYLHRRGKPSRTPRCLPDAHYVSDLSLEDERKMLSCLDKKMGPKAVESQRYNLNTNRCESSHRTTQMSVPKHKTFVRTFKGRVHSACHTMSVGKIRSMVLVNKHLGAANDTGTPAFKALKFLHKRNTYMKIRNKCKSLRIKRVKKKLYTERSKEVKRDFGHTNGCDDVIITTEHNYRTRYQLRNLRCDVLGNVQKQ